MARGILGVIALVFIYFSSSCNRQPDICFTVDTDTVYVGQPIAITNCSEHAERYEWQFEYKESLIEVNTTISELSEEEPTFTWFVPGTYAISLRGYSKNDKKQGDRSRTITVYDRCFTCFTDAKDTVRSCSSITYFNENLSDFPTYAGDGYTCEVRTLTP